MGGGEIVQYNWGKGKRISFPFLQVHQYFTVLEVKALVNLSPCQNTK